MITLVPFYKILNETKISKKLKKRINNNNQFNYLDALDKLRSTFLKTNPEGRFVVQTDTVTKLDFPDVFRSDLINCNLIEAIVISNLNFIKQNQGKIILVGTDHLISGSLDSIFQEDYDIATCVIGDQFDDTHRTNIINFMFVNSNKNNHNNIIKFFEDRKNVFNNFEERDRLWWGDQKSLSVMLETKNIISKYYESKGENNIFDYNGLKIKLFQYNDNFVGGSDSKGNIANEKSLIIDFAGNKMNFNHVYGKIMEK